MLETLHYVPRVKGRPNRVQIDGAKLHPSQNAAEKETKFVCSRAYALIFAILGIF